MASPGAAEASVKPLPAVLPQVVARVNGQAIPKDELERAVQSFESRIGRQVPPERRAALYRGVLEQLVGFTLLSQESKARKVEVPEAEVQARIAAIGKQFPSKQAFEQALARKGTSLTALRKETRSSLTVQHLLQDVVGPGISVSQEEVRSFYEANKQRFEKGESVRASHILIRLPKGADAAAREKAKARAEQVLQKLHQGGDFAALAKQYSEDPGSAARGGDLGYFTRGQMVPAFDKAAFALKVGETSGLVESSFGFHIIRVADRKPAQIAALDQVADQIGQYLEAQKRGQAVQAFVQKLRAKGKVEILI